MLAKVTQKQMYKIMDQMLNGVEVTVTGPGVEEFKQQFARDMAYADANGLTIDIPFDLATASGDNEVEEYEEIEEEDDDPELEVDLSALNMSCATGESGEIDPTCKTGSGGRSLSTLPGNPPYKGADETRVVDISPPPPKKGKK